MKNPMIQSAFYGVVLSVLGILINLGFLSVGGADAIWATPTLIALLTLLACLVCPPKYIVLPTLIFTILWGLFLAISGWCISVTFTPELNGGGYGYDKVEGWLPWWPYLLPLFVAGLSCLKRHK